MDDEKVNIYDYISKADSAIDSMKAEGRWDNAHQVVKTISEMACAAGISAYYENEYRRAVMQSLPSVKNAKVICKLEPNIAKNATDELSSCK